MEHTPENPVEKLTECNICFNTIDIDNLAICGNKKCSFKMCSQCIRSYKQFDNKNCPQCRLPITTRQFSRITPKKIEPNVAPISHRECFIKRGCDAGRRRCDAYVSNREYCSQPNKNIFKCVTGAAFVICVPKILGYYLCKGCVVDNVSVIDAWRSCEGVNDICQPLAGAAALGMSWGIGYTCFEVIKNRGQVMQR